MKKILSVILSLALVLGIGAVGAVNANAYTDWQLENFVNSQREKNNEAYIRETYESFQTYYVGEGWPAYHYDILVKVLDSAAMWLITSYSPLNEEVLAAYMKGIPERDWLGLVEAEYAFWEWFNAVVPGMVDSLGYISEADHNIINDKLWEVLAFFWTPYEDPNAPATYTLTYDLQDPATGGPNPLVVTGIPANTTVTLSTAIPLNIDPEKVFGGWSASEDIPLRITSIVMDSDKTVYAIWNEKNDDDDGDGDPPPNPANVLLWARMMEWLRQQWEKLREATRWQPQPVSVSQWLSQMFEGVTANPLTWGKIVLPLLKVGLQFVPQVRVIRVLRWALALI